MATGKIARPIYGNGNKNLTLTATLTKGSVSKTITFEASVKEADMTDTQAVDFDLASITIPGANAIVNNIALQSKGTNGTTITWSSSDSDSITDSGIVTRPANSSPNVTVTMTASVTKGAITKTKDITCIVKAWTDQEEVEAASSTITFDTIKGSNISRNNITNDLVLPSTIGDGITITWLSSSQSVMANSGTLTSPSFTTGNISFSLTATLTKGTSSKTVYIVGLTATALPITNTEAVTRAIGLVTDSTIKTGNANLSTVLSNLTLPKSVSDANSSAVRFVWNVLDAGGTITTTDPYVSITDNISDFIATITRPSSASPNQSVKIQLVAQSSSYSGTTATAYKEFNLTIIHL